MSHLKNPPVPNSVYPRSLVRSLMLLVASVACSGCAMIQVPSYRLEECAEENYSSTPTLFPPVPMPGWLARWKAEKHLPKPPASPRFHPLPTRPMFQPPIQSEFSEPGTAAVCYGKLPLPESWSEHESVPAVPVPNLAAPQ